MAAWTWSSNSAVAARAAVRDRRSASSAPHSPVGVVRFHAAAARARLPDVSPHRQRHSTSAYASAGFAPSRTLRYADWFNLYRPLNCYDSSVLHPVCTGPSASAFAVMPRRARIARVTPRVTIGSESDGQDTIGPIFSNERCPVANAEFQRKIKKRETADGGFQETDTLDPSVIPPRAHLLDPQGCQRVDLRCPPCGPITGQERRGEEYDHSGGVR